jgi:hypothetical protein
MRAAFHFKLLASQRTYGTAAGGTTFPYAGPAPSLQCAPCFRYERFQSAAASERIAARDQPGCESDIRARARSQYGPDWRGSFRSSSAVCVRACAGTSAHLRT